VYYLVQQAKNAEIKGAKIMYSNSRRTGTIFQQGVKVKNHLFNISEVSIFWPQSQILGGSVDPPDPDFPRPCVIDLIVKIMSHQY